MARILDCLVIGGGPAGLTAAIYAARFHLSVRVIDAGASRAGQIPCTRNYPGFPEGISGPDLLGRLRDQALKYGADIVEGHVDALARRDDDFLITTSVDVEQSRAVLLATGVTNRRPPMAADLHAEAVATGRLRYCPVCDGFEVTDQNVAVIGAGSGGVRETLFLRAYTRRLTLISPDGFQELTPKDRRALEAAGVELLDGPVSDLRLEDEGLSLDWAGGRKTFDTVYPALGSDVHSDLARGLGAALTADGCVKVDAHQRTSVSGLYAAGDVVIGLDQISHAMGEAGVAVTAIRNDLDARAPLRRP